MKRTLFLSACFGLIANFSWAQTPELQWKKNLEPYSYGTYGENIYSMSRVKSGGFIFVGSDTLYNPSKTGLLNKEYGERPMIMKTDGSGNTLWARKLPAYEYYSFFSSVIETDKQEFVTVGYGRNYVNSSYRNDLIVAKYLSNGDLSWYKALGGSQTEYGQSVIQSKDGNFVVAGYTNSNDVNVSGNHGTNTYDLWVVKLDNSGTILWQRCFGGSGDDKAYSIKQTSDGGYIVVGKNNSVNGNVTNNKGGNDGWVLKLDSNGNLQWEKSIGGSLEDVFESVAETADGSYIVSGYTYSNDKDISGNHGDADVLIVKLGSTGNIIWRKCFGGSAEDRSYSIEKAVDGAFLVAGHTLSNNGDVTANNGGSDVWLIKIDTAGSLIWQKTTGSAKNEYSMSVAAISESLFAVAGFGDPETTGNYLDGYLYELGNASTIKGTVFMDYNANGSKETSEPYINNVMVKTEKTGFAQSAIPFNGSFKIDVDTGAYKTSATFYSPYYTVAPTVHNTTFNTYFNIDSFNFAVQPIPGKRDLSVDLIPLVPARPGFQTQYKIFYKNKGTDTIAAGTVQFVKSNKLQFLSSVPTFNAAVGDTIRFNYSNLKPDDSASIIINLKVAAPPAVNIGDQLFSIATISPVATDLTPADDTSKLVQRVVGSYDPNDKTERNGGIIQRAQVNAGDYLLYTIRFQNTGTDTAFNIVIRDTLSEKVDWNTLQMVTASHSYQLNIKDGDKVTWSFNNIKLVDSVRNEPRSHGYIVYQVKPKTSILPGDTIKNTAGIYFDFNLPVSTNTERTVVESSVLPVQLVSFGAKRNGKQNQLEWLIDAETNLTEYTIERSSNGRDFITIGNVKAINNSNYSFTDFSPARAVNYYRLKMTDKDGKFEYSDVRKVNNGGSFKVSIYPNPVKNDLQIEIESEKNIDLQLQVAQLDGKVLHSGKLVAVSGSSIKNLNVTALPTGTYFLILSTKGEQTAIKFDKL